MVSKRLSKVNKERQDKAASPASKSKKRKLSELLGSHWSKDELEYFYEAFRKYGKNWKKVAAAVHNRSIDMVETLYNINKAYLSLPEGTATAAGLVAMMTDHYNVLGEHGRKHNSDPLKKPHHSQKCVRRKTQLVTSKRSDGPYPVQLKTQPAHSSYRCVSAVKKKRSGDLLADSQPRVVGKRTPRIPVVYSHDKGGTDNTVMLNKHISKHKMDADDNVHEAASILIQISQGGASLPVQGNERKYAASEMAHPNYTNIRLGDYHLGGLLVSGEAVNGGSTGHSRVMDSGGLGANETQLTLKMYQRRRPKSLSIKTCHSDDVLESCNSREGHYMRMKDETEGEVLNQKVTEITQSPREKICQLLSGDEVTAIWALQHLAGPSTNNLQQASAGKTEPFPHIKEQKGNDGSVSQSNVRGQMLQQSHDCDNLKILIGRDSENSSVVEVDVIIPEGAKPEDLLPKGTLSETKERSYPYVNMMQNRHQRFLEAQIPDTEIHNDSCLVVFQKNKDMDCVPPKPVILSEPLENMPQDRKQINTVDMSHTNFADEKLVGHSMQLKSRGPEKSTSQILYTPCGVSCASSCNQHDNFLKEAKGHQIDAFIQSKDAAKEVVAAGQHANFISQPSMLEQIQSMEADTKYLTQLTQALDQKEGLHKELKRMTQQISGKGEKGDSGRESEHLSKKQANIIHLLNDANDQVNSALHHLKQCNNNDVSLCSTSFFSMNTSGRPGGPLCSYNTNNRVNQDLNSHVVDIVETSTWKSRAIVDIALQAMSSLKEGEDAYMKIGEALNSTKNQPYRISSSRLGTRCSCSDPGLDKAAYQYSKAPSMLDSTPTVQDSSNVHDVSLLNVAQHPSELISACVSTLLMIQACSEHRYPPAEVVKVLDHAVRSLHPCYSENLPIFREIEKCMGIIKTQTLALVATPSNGLPT